MLADAVLSRIAERDVARRERVAETAAARHADVGSDLEAVTERLNKIQLRLEALTDTGRKADLDAAAVGIKGFYQDVQENAWLLPEHKLRQRQLELEQLQQRLNAAVADAKPRKKFSFNSKSHVVPAAAAAAPTTMQELVQQAEAAEEAHYTAAVPSMAAPKVPKANAVPLSTDCAVTGYSKERLIRRGAAVRGTDFVASDLTDCTLLLLSPLSALRLQRLQRCTVVAGPVSGAVFMDGTVMQAELAAKTAGNNPAWFLADLVDCTVMLAAHQFRCHTSQRVTAWLEVGSNPIIEDCSGMVFGGLSTHNSVLLTAQPDYLPVCSDSATPAKAAAAAQGPRRSGDVSTTADEAGIHTRSATDASKWAAVKDFNHVLTCASSNWRLAAESDIQCEMSSDGADPPHLA